MIWSFNELVTCLKLTQHCSPTQTKYTGDAMTRGIPQPPKEKPIDTSTAVEVDEVTFILDTTLLPHHATDPKVVTFISRYLLCRHTAQAARESGLAAADGRYLIQRPDIYTAIRKITDRAIMKHGYDAGEVIERVKEMSDVDPGDLQDPATGEIVENLHRLPVATRRAIKKFKAKNIYETDPNGIPRVVGKMIEVEFHDKMRANELLGREKDLFVEKKKVEHGVSADMKSVLLDSKRLAQEFIAEQIAAPEMKDVTPSGEDDGAD